VRGAVMIAAKPDLTRVQVGRCIDQSAAEAGRVAVGNVALRRRWSRIALMAARLALPLVVMFVVAGCNGGSNATPGVRCLLPDGACECPGEMICPQAQVGDMTRPVFFVCLEGGALAKTDASCVAEPP